MGDNVGTLRKVVLAGITFDVFGDVNITFNRNKYEKEGIPTTGDNLIKRTKRIQTIESLDLKTNPSEMEDLNDLADSLADITMSVELADGSVYKATGQVNFENYESDTGKSTCTLIPKRDWYPVLN